MTEAELRSALNTIIAQIKAYQANNNENSQESLATLEQRSAVLSTQYDLIKDESPAQNLDKSFSEAFQSEAFRGEVKRLVSGPGFQYSSKDRLKKVTTFNEFKLLCKQALAEIKGRIEALKSAAPDAAAAYTSLVSDSSANMAASAPGSVLQTVPDSSATTEAVAGAKAAVLQPFTGSQDFSSGSVLSSDAPAIMKTLQFVSGAGDSDLAHPSFDNENVTATAATAAAAGSDTPASLEKFNAGQSAEALPQNPDMSAIIQRNKEIGAGLFERRDSYLKEVCEFVELCEEVNADKKGFFPKTIEDVKKKYKTLKDMKLDVTQEKIKQELRITEKVEQLYQLTITKYPLFERAVKAYEKACLSFLQKATKGSLQGKFNAGDVEKAYAELTAVSEAALKNLTQYPACAARKEKMDSINTTFQAYVKARNAFKKAGQNQDEAAGLSFVKQAEEIAKLLDSDASEIAQAMRVNSTTTLEKYASPARSTSRSGRKPSSTQSSAASTPVPTPAMSRAKEIIFSKAAAEDLANKINRLRSLANEIDAWEVVKSETITKKNAELAQAYEEFSTSVSSYLLANDNKVTEIDKEMFNQGEQLYQSASSNLLFKPYELACKAFEQECQTIAGQKLTNTDDLAAVLNTTVQKLKLKQDAVVESYAAVSFELAELKNKKESQSSAEVVEGSAGQASPQNEASSVRLAKTKDLYTQTITKIPTLYATLYGNITDVFIIQCELFISSDSSAVSAESLTKTYNALQDYYQNLLSAEQKKGEEIANKHKAVRGEYQKVQEKLIAGDFAQYLADLETSFDHTALEALEKRTKELQDKADDNETLTALLKRARILSEKLKLLNQIDETARDLLSKMRAVLEDVTTSAVMKAVSGAYPDVDQSLTAYRAAREQFGNGLCDQSTTLALIKDDPNFGALIEKKRAEVDAKENQLPLEIFEAKLCRLIQSGAELNTGDNQKIAQSYLQIFSEQFTKREDLETRKQGNAAPASATTAATDSHWLQPLQASLSRVLAAIDTYQPAMQMQELTGNVDANSAEETNNDPNEYKVKVLNELASLVASSDCLPLVDQINQCRAQKLGEQLVSIIKRSAPLLSQQFFTEKFVVNKGKPTNQVSTQLDAFPAVSSDPFTTEKNTAFQTAKDYIAALSQVRNPEEEKATLREVLQAIFDRINPVRAFLIQNIGLLTDPKESKVGLFSRKRLYEFYLHYQALFNLYKPLLDALNVSVTPTQSILETTLLHVTGAATEAISISGALQNELTDISLLPSIQYQKKHYDRGASYDDNERLVELSADMTEAYVTHAGAGRSNSQSSEGDLIKERQQQPVLGVLAPRSDCGQMFASINTCAPLKSAVAGIKKENALASLEKYAATVKEYHVQFFDGNFSNLGSFFQAFQFFQSSLADYTKAYSNEQLSSSYQYLTRLTPEAAKRIKASYEALQQADQATTALLNEKFEEVLKKAEILPTAIEALRSSIEAYKENLKDCCDQQAKVQAALQAYQEKLVSLSELKALISRFNELMDSVGEADTVAACQQAIAALSTEETLQSVFTESPKLLNAPKQAINKKIEEILLEQIAKAKNSFSSIGEHFGNVTPKDLTSYCDTTKNTISSIQQRVLGEINAAKFTECLENLSSAIEAMKTAASGKLDTLLAEAEKKLAANVQNQLTVLQKELAKTNPSAEDLKAASSACDEAVRYYLTFAEKFFENKISKQMSADFAAVQSAQQRANVQLETMRSVQEDYDQWFAKSSAAKAMPATLADCQTARNDLEAELELQVQLKATLSNEIQALQTQQNVKLEKHTQETITFLGRYFSCVIQKVQAVGTEKFPFSVENFLLLLAAIKQLADCFFDAAGNPTSSFGKEIVVPSTYEALLLYAFTVISEKIGAVEKNQAEVYKPCLNKINELTEQLCNISQQWSIDEINRLVRYSEPPKNFDNFADEYQRVRTASGNQNIQSDIANKGAQLAEVDQSIVRMEARMPAERLAILGQELFILLSACSARETDIVWLQQATLSTLQDFARESKDNSQFTQKEKLYQRIWGEIIKKLLAVSRGYVEQMHQRVAGLEAAEQVEARDNFISEFVAFKKFLSEFTAQAKPSLSFLSAQTFDIAHQMQSPLQQLDRDFNVVLEAAVGFAVIAAVPAQLLVTPPAEQSPPVSPAKSSSSRKNKGRKTNPKTKEVGIASSSSDQSPAAAADANVFAAATSPKGKTARHKPSDSVSTTVATPVVKESRKPEELLQLAVTGLQAVVEKYQAIVGDIKLKNFTNVPKAVSDAIEKIVKALQEQLSALNQTFVHNTFADDDAVKQALAKVKTAQTNYDSFVQQVILLGYYSQDKKADVLQKGVEFSEATQRSILQSTQQAICATLTQELQQLATAIFAKKDIFNAQNAQTFLTKWSQVNSTLLEKFALYELSTEVRDAFVGSSFSAIKDAITVATQEILQSLTKAISTLSTEDEDKRLQAETVMNEATTFIADVQKESLCDETSYVSVVQAIAEKKQQIATQRREELTAVLAAQITAAAVKAAAEELAKEDQEERGRAENAKLEGERLAVLAVTAAQQEQAQEPVAVNAEETTAGAATAIINNERLPAIQQEVGEEEIAPAALTLASSSSDVSTEPFANLTAVELVAAAPALTGAAVATPQEAPAVAAPPPVTAANSRRVDLDKPVRPLRPVRVLYACADGRVSESEQAKTFSIGPDCIMVKETRKDRERAPSITSLDRLPASSGPATTRADEPVAARQQQGQGRAGAWYAMGLFFHQLVARSGSARSDQPLGLRTTLALSEPAPTPASSASDGSDRHNDGALYGETVSTLKPG